ncbi:MAG: DUF1549 domain-containing protein, partial [Planctomycetes bacterium]|nr:DUF1549 domain-containing protein [Planctomycetota bacterium]
MILVFSAAGFGAQASADEPLHRRIDALMDAARTGPAPAASDDATFLRRLHLDLWGCIPGAEDVAAFLEDQSPGKREQAVDRLLDDPRFVRRMTIVLDR